MRRCYLPLKHDSYPRIVLHLATCSLPCPLHPVLQERNGYLRFTASHTSLTLEAVSTDDGSLMDTFTLNRG